MHIPSRFSCHGVRLKAIRRGRFRSTAQHANSAVVPNTVKIVLKKRKNPYITTKRKVETTPAWNHFNTSFMVGEGGFEPPKSVTTDLQSAPFDRSGIPPCEVVPSVIRPKDCGAGGRIRTPDLLITNQLLYRLSYTSGFGLELDSVAYYSR